MVRIAFCGLAIPEPSWPEVVEEAARVLKRHSGVLEVSKGSYAVRSLLMSVHESDHRHDLHPATQLFAVTPLLV